MTRSVASVVTETLFLVAGCLALLLWIIPAQTSEGGFGLSPAFLPNACTAAIVVLVLADGVQRLLSGRRDTVYPENYRAALLIGGVAVAGALALMWGGVALSATVCTALGMLAMGERRPVPVLMITALCGGVFWLIFR